MVILLVFMVFVVYIVGMTQAHIPNKPEIQASKAMLEVLPHSKTIEVQIGGKQFALPEGLRAQLEQLLSYTANGKASLVTAFGDELSSAEAAEYLRVSRQFLVNEADAGRIAYRKVGTHRRFALADVLAYHAMTEQESLEARQALADQAQALGWDD
jgi:excisionase family DNA binding protein